MPDVVLTEADFPLVYAALRLSPQAEMAALCVKAVRERLKFPISTVDELLSLVADDSDFEINEHKFSYDGVKAYMPTECFPIASEERLLILVAIALQRAHQDAVVARNARPEGKGEVFVDPAIAYVPGAPS